LFSDIKILCSFNQKQATHGSTTFGHDLIRVNGVCSINNGSCTVGFSEITFVPSAVTTVGQTGQTTYLSQNPNIDPNFPIQRLLIKGNVIFNLNKTIESTTSSLSFIAMDEYAKITVPNGKILQIRGRDVLGCIRRWNSIDVESGGSISTSYSPSNFFQKTNIKDADNAIIARDNSNITLTSTQLFSL
jgi:hypothetical protein